MKTFYQLGKKYQNKKKFISNEKESLNYKEFFSLCERVKTLLKPLQPGDVLCFYNKSQAKFLSFLMACLDKGIHFLPAYENLNILEYESLKKKIKPHYELSDSLKLVPCYPSSTKLDLPAGVIFQTSGSLGVSKFIYQSQKNLINNALRAQKYQEINTNSKAFVPIALSHIGGLNMQTLATFMSQGEVCFSNKAGFSKLKFFFDKNLTHAVLVPSHLRWIIQHPQWEKQSFSSPVTILTGSCPVSYDFFQKISNKENLRLLGVYGMTEIGPFTSIVEADCLSNIRQDLFPIGKECFGFSFKLSHKNEILIKGPSMGKYIERGNNKKGWKIVDCGNPWVHSGDKGVKDKDFFYYQGRIKREINLGGFKINPEKIEEILKQHPKVKNCFVYAEKDPIWHEIPVAKIVSKSISVAELKTFLKNHVGSLNIPRKWILVEGLKTSSIDKILISNEKTQLKHPTTVLPKLRKMLK